MIILKKVFMPVVVFIFMLPYAVHTQETQDLSNVETQTSISKFFYRTKTVRCDKGAKLSRYLSRARPGDTLKIVGSCNQAIEIAKDNIHLVGLDGAVIDGSGIDSEAVVLIEGARGVKLQGLTIQNGSDQGILARRGAQGILEDLLVSENQTVGISLDRAQFDLSNIQVSGNGSSGMDIFTSSTVVAKGNISATDNQGDGIAVNGNSFFELRGAQVTASSNGGTGVSIINDSRLQIFSFPEAQGSSVTAENNGFAGIGILASEIGVVGAEFFGSGANVMSANGNVLGFFMVAGAILSPHATAQFVARNNGVGMLMEDGASAVIVGGLTLSQNGIGMTANGANTVNVVSVPPNPSSVDNNQLDVSAEFGSRMTFSGVAFSSISCDDTVLVRGDLVCP